MVIILCVIPVDPFSVPLV